jgi:DGQHR domain-containing protein
LSDFEAVAQIGPDEMSRLFWISRFEDEDPDSPAIDHHGYQRQPIMSRIPGISKYYSQPGARTTPINLSVRVPLDEVDDFLAAWNEGDIDDITRRWGKAVVSVVDGQHRFLGIVDNWQKNSDWNPKVPVMLNFGMSFAEEAEFFDVINSTQRKLPKALIEITKADVTESANVDHAQRVRQIATMLARHPESVWHGQVNLTGARDPNKPVTFEGLRRSTVAMFPKEILARLVQDGKDVDEVARAYWALIADACSEAWKGDSFTVDEDEFGNTTEVRKEYRIKELVGVASLARLGKDIIASALEHDNFAQRMRSLAFKLAYVDWEKRKGNSWMASQAGFAGQADLYQVLYKWVYLGLNPED